MKWGGLFRLGSMWYGLHYSYKERRFCFTFPLFCTFWFTLKGGQPPSYARVSPLKSWIGACSSVMLHVSGWSLYAHGYSTAAIVGLALSIVGLGIVAYHNPDLR
jgi:hypothetical protein